jgi:potassium/chloride transporter 4/5/6
MSHDVTQGVASLIQTSGLGGLKHNTTLLTWPKEWRKTYTDHKNDFLEALRTSKAAGLASVVSKVETDWPTTKLASNKTIDIWWIIHDGGLIILLSYLLKQNPVWKNCRLRLFAVAEETDNSIKMEKDLRDHLSRLRIDALIRVVELTKQDISAYAHQVYSI